MQERSVFRPPKLKIILLLLPFFFILWFAGTAQSVQASSTPESGSSSPVDQWVKSQVNNLPKDKVESYWDQLMKDYGGFFPDGATPTLMDMLLPGDKGLSLKGVLSGLLGFMWHEVLYNGKLLVTIVMISVLSMILETLQTAFERKTVSKVAYTLCYMVVLVIAVNSFNIAIGYAKDAIDRMIDFMMAMIPLLFALLASMGNIVTVSVTHPLIVFMIHTVGTMIHTLVFPLLFFSAVLHLVSALSEKYKLTQLANLLRNIGAGLLGVLLTVFLGVISVRGITSSVTDGVTIRAAKYITGNFVPVIGKMFADATDTVISASLLVKNAIGLSGVIIILFLCAFPAIKILVLALIYNIAAAVMQPLGETPIVVCLQTIGKSMVYVFAALAAVSLMFFMAVTIMLTAGNLTVMMR
ncbi:MULTISPECIES: stage III sporulation protein AE [Paenibacillus]|jgi:stage III sporulation protein AE|uniref:Stage III sporulation protein AE n=1 Tax=Paenibacillus odorifer TaxID=189426 RepID=A0AAD0KQK2_9BACL|nr:MULTISPECIES: stage III sporulation protein AE [Paenibacillus]AIQ75649.1 stage III sporulation protein AE [Paenibacillus odorifer]AWV34953.1 stage III sporulation protein AE [Paenibacillus odorifer]ETT57501.1 stage III sporulation protein AE [Paenibacillus sp. FSL H8-237]MDH6429679.1 stage III sporulation protein AE [Paenibacillus sp. PastH-4]MDH6446223.1 stage III sporulation protein AE [Paenibacillus sp. PastF-4]